jgi:hypothetical protein
MSACVGLCGMYAAYLFLGRWLCYWSVCKCSAACVTQPHGVPDLTCAHDRAVPRDCCVHSAHCCDSFDRCACWQMLQRSYAAFHPAVPVFGWGLNHFECMRRAACVFCRLPGAAVPADVSRTACTRHVHGEVCLCDACIRHALEDDAHNMHCTPGNLVDTLADPWVSCCGSCAAAGYLLVGCDTKSVWRVRPVWVAGHLLRSTEERLMDGGFS